MKRLTATIIAALFCAACGTTQLKNSPALNLSDVDAIHIMPDTPLLIRADNAKIISTAELLDMVEQVDYIKLDSSEPIGEISKMIVTGDKIFILDAHIAQQIFVFDRTGKLLYRIKNKGRGPKEYISIWDMQVDTIRNEILLNDALARSYLYFSADDGQFIRREKGIANCYVARIDSLYVNLQNNGQDFNDEENWAILITDKDSVIYKGFEFKPIQEGDYIVNSFYRDNDGSLLYTPINSDTVYQFTSPMAAYAKYVVCQERSIWKLYNERLSEPEICKLIKERNYTRYSANFLTTKNHVFFSIQHKWNAYITSRPYFWDKRTNSIYEWKISKPSIICDIIGLPQASYNNIFISTFPSIKTPEEYKNTLNPRLKKLLDNSNEGDNPILALYTLK
ncbi:6-bladed beta-propeller [uncultured Alistipes sp.]|uniref:6-bladed beta-propeller n=1 Tax=uncultured Alistipes sp. TaxID=538949 RepID=UPI0025913F60|nr:6-bladed beta-propeller [uncultured Alistipes sp.]